MVHIDFKNRSISLFDLFYDYRVNAFIQISLILVPFEPYEQGVE